jgi:hypothetical protein
VVSVPVPTVLVLGLSVSLLDLGVLVIRLGISVLVLGLGVLVLRLGVSVLVLGLGVLPLRVAIVVTLVCSDETAVDTRCAQVLPRGARRDATAGADSEKKSGWREPSDAIHGFLHRSEMRRIRWRRRQTSGIEGVEMPLVTSIFDRRRFLALAFAVGVWGLGCSGLIPRSQPEPLRRV